MAERALTAAMRRLADAEVMDGDTENYLREAADRLEQCEDEAHQVVDEITATELELRDRLVAAAVASGGERA